jgi:acyl-coenzyme A synthetase/AMP-(fatty) acid ligase
LLKSGQLERHHFPDLHTVLFAGEVFAVRHLREVMDCFKSAAFYNLYGPTETNVCTYLPVPRPIPDSVTDLSIGQSCANYDAFALTAEGRRATAGEEGELVVRGPGVMMGYWDSAERTAQSLVQNPLHHSYVDRVYRTGDIVQVGGDGNFVFLGRRDHMVKTRGYRVELGEIEHALLQNESVHTAVVVPVPDDEVGARLHAVVVPEVGHAVTAVDLTDFCRTRLPHYAVPEAFTIVHGLPETSTGKIDRRRVASMVLSDSQPDNN